MQSKDAKESLKAIFLLGTLKRKPGFSHTDTLCEFLIEHLAPYKITSEIIRLADHTILPGIETHVGKNDDWPDILQKILAADIIIFATPIWWGIQSSLIQRVIERMDALNDELLETGKSELDNKIGGMVITGAEDGAQHVIGNLANFMVWNGLTLPPACSLSWLGDASGDTKETLKKKFYKETSIKYMAEVMAHNLAFYAKLLKQHPLPRLKTHGIVKAIPEGTVGMRGRKN